MNGKITIEAILDDANVQKGLAKIAGLGEQASGKGGIGGLASSVGKLAGAGLVFKGVSMGIDAIKSSMSGAISRFDTMNKFPIMMQEMGYSANESRRSINKLSRGIDGLPTALNEVVATTQQLTLSTGDLNKSTDLTLALNNAFLASGASAGDASRGLIQFSQMLNKGQVDMQSWRTLQETMPVALRKTAEAFGYTGKSATLDFYDALRDGEITFDEFGDKLIELNEGVDGFAKLARVNSKGIATSFKNIGTAVVKGTANMLSAIDNALKTWGLPSIADSFDSLKSVVNGTFKFINKGIGKFAKLAKPAVEQLKEFGSFAVKSFKGVSKLFGLFNGKGTLQSIKNRLMDMGLSEEMSMKVMDFTRNLRKQFDGVVSVLKQYGSIIGNHWKGVFNSLGKVMKGDFKGAFNDLETTFKNTFKSLSNLASETVPKVIDGLKNIGNGIQTWVFDKFDVKSWGQLGSNAVNSLGSGIKKGITAIGDVAGNLYEWVSGQLSKVDWGNLGANAGNLLGSGIRFTGKTVATIAKSIQDGIFKATNASNWLDVALNVGDRLAKSFNTITVNFDKFASNFLDNLAGAVLGIDLGVVKSKLETTFQDLSKIKFTGDFGKLARDIESAIKKSFSGFSWEKTLDFLFKPPKFSWGSWEGAIGDIKKQFSGWLDDIKTTVSNFDWGDAWNKLLNPPTTEFSGGTSGGSGGGSGSGGLSKFNQNTKRESAENIKIMESWGSDLQVKQSGIFTGVGNLMTGAWNGISTGAGHLWNGLTSLFNTGGSQISNSAGTTATNVVNQSANVSAGANHYRNFSTLSSGAVSGMQSPISSALSFITGQAQTQGSAVSNASSLYSGFSSKSKTSIASMQSPISSALSAITGRARSEGQGVESTSSNYRNLNSKSTSILGSMLMMARTRFSNITRNANSESSSLNRGVSNQYRSMVSNISNSLNRAVASMRSASGQARGAGYQMGSGFYNGLASMSGSIISLAYSIASRAAAAMRSALRVHSPSRVTTEIGMFTGKGLVVGMEKEAINVERASQLLASKAIPSIKPSAVLGLDSAYGDGSVNHLTSTQKAELNIGTFVSNGKDDIDYLMREFEWRTSQKLLGGMT